MGLAQLEIQQPDWLDGHAAWDKSYASDEKKVDLAIGLARENMNAKTGSPFGAVVFDGRTHRPVGVGVNLVRACANSILHAETMAIMNAQAGLKLCSLSAEDADYVLAASSEPCAMCLGAAWYAGIRRLVYGTLGPELHPYGFGLGPGLKDLAGFLKNNGFTWQGGIGSGKVLRIMEQYRAQTQTG